MQTIQTNNNDFDFEELKSKLSLIMPKKNQFLAFLYLKCSEMVTNLSTLNKESDIPTIQNGISTLEPYRFWEYFLNNFSESLDQLDQNGFIAICLLLWERNSAENFNIPKLVNTLNSSYSQFSQDNNYVLLLQASENENTDNMISSLISTLNNQILFIISNGKNLFNEIHYTKGNASGDGSCFIHSVLAHMTWEEFLTIKNWVDNNDFKCPYSKNNKTFLETVKENRKCNDSVNHDQVCYLRAYIAIFIYTTYRNNLSGDNVFEIQVLLGINVIDQRTGLPTNGFVGYSSSAALAISQILNRPFLIIAPSMQINTAQYTQGYIFTHKQNDNWTCENFSLASMQPNDNIDECKMIIAEAIINYKQNGCICVHFNGYNHYVPIAYNESLTDAGKFENNNRSELQLPPKPLPQPKQTNQPQNQQKTITPKAVIQNTNQTQNPIQQQKIKPQPKQQIQQIQQIQQKKPQKTNTSSVVQISKSKTIEEEKMKARKELINLFYGEKVAKQIKFNDREIVSLIIQQFEGFSKYVNGKCETIFKKIDDYGTNSNVTENFSYETRNRNIIDNCILTSNLPISQKSAAICFFTLFKKSNKFDEFDKVFFEKPLNLKIISLIFVASNIGTNFIEGINEISVFSSQKNFQNFINQISKNEKLMEFLYVNPESIFTLLNSYQNKLDFKRHIKHFENELQIIKTDKKFMISLNLLANEYLPVGCRIDFFDKFFSLDASHKKFIFQLLNKYKPKYIMPVVYLIINANYFPEDKYLSQYINQIDITLDINKELHMYFLNKIGIKTLKNNPKLSSIVNLLSKDKLELCSESIKQSNCDMDTFFLPLYDLSLPMINIVIECSYKFKMSPKEFINKNPNLNLLLDFSKMINVKPIDLLKVYKYDISKLILDIESISKNEAAKKSFLDFPKMLNIKLIDLFEIYKYDITKLKLDIEFISKNESIKKSLQIKEYKNLFLQNPNLFLKTFIETQKKLKEAEKTKEDFSFLQTKEIKEIVEFAGYNNNETNQQKRSLNSLKQYCIAKSLNTMQDGEKLAIDIAEAVKIANKELII